MTVFLSYIAPLLLVQDHCLILCLYSCPKILQLVKQDSIILFNAMILFLSYILLNLVLEYIVEIP